MNLQQLTQIESLYALHQVSNVQIVEVNGLLFGIAIQKRIGSVLVTMANGRKQEETILALHSALSRGEDIVYEAMLAHFRDLSKYQDLSMADEGLLKKQVYDLFLRVVGGVEPAAYQVYPFLDRYFVPLLKECLGHAEVVMQSSRTMRAFMQEVYKTFTATN